MELQLSGKGVIKMKAIQCCYFLALVSSHLMAGVMGDDNIFLSNSIQLLYIVWLKYFQMEKIF